jgi:large conductance mechanosensitive channel
MKRIKKDRIANKSKGLFDEFKEFIRRGNVLDLAVGVIMGSAFGKIISSLVDNILMPIIGIIIGGYYFSDLAIKVGGARIKYGLFIQNVIDFLIVAVCIFIFVKVINKILTKNKEEEKEEPKEEIKEEVILLREIRDSLNSSKKSTRSAKKK